MHCIRICSALQSELYLLRPWPSMGFWDSTSAPRVAVCARLRLTRRRPLIAVQDAELALIDRRPGGGRGFISRGLLSVLCRDKGGIPATTIFDNAALCGVVNVDDAEALAVAFRPLEVIQQRPDEVTPQRYPLC